MRFTIGIKILLGFGLALLIQSAVGIVAYYNTVRMSENAEWRSHSYTVLGRLDNLTSEAVNAETGQRGFLLTGRDEYLAPYHQGVKRLNITLAELKKLTVDNPQQQTRLEQLAPLLDAKVAELQQTIDLRREKGADAAVQVVLTDQGRAAMEQIRDLVAKLTGDERALLKQRDEETKSSARATQWTILYGSASAFVLVALCGTLIQRSITRPLGRFVDFVDRVGKGDLTRGAEVTSGDEVGRLGEMINEMVVGLRSMTEQIQAVSENVNSATAQISSSAKQQVASTKEQAATVQQITSTMQEISQTGAQIVSKAREVAVAAEQSSSVSKSGLEAVENTTRTMESIREQVEEVAEHIVALSEKTQAVGEIISTVNDIAEQSNLLALNATIEAADAGQEGNRFSVVASEMKNLADQAKECTVHVRKILGEIQKAINTSVMLTEEAVKRVESGKQQADVSENVIRQFSSTNDESIQAFQQIIAATNQQQIGVEQVARGMQSIDQATQQTATGTNQLEQAVVSLSALSRQLHTAVATYKM